MGRSGTFSGTAYSDPTENMPYEGYESGNFWVSTSRSRTRPWPNTPRRLWPSIPNPPGRIQDSPLNFTLVTEFSSVSVGLHAEGGYGSTVLRAHPSSPPNAEFGRSLHGVSIQGWVFTCVFRQLRACCWWQWRQRRGLAARAVLTALMVVMPWWWRSRGSCGSGTSGRGCAGHASIRTRPGGV